MKSTLAALALAIAVPVAAVGIASATPSAGVAGVEHVAGARLPAGVKVNADGVKLHTKAPTDVSVLTLTVDPGGTTGWHGHPGVAVIAVSEGVGKLYAADCTATTYRAGDAFVEGGDDPPTVFRNESTSPVVLTVSFIAPRGADIIEGRPDPGCGLS